MMVGGAKASKWSGGLLAAWRRIGNAPKVVSNLHSRPSRAPERFGAAPERFGAAPERFHAAPRLHGAAPVAQPARELTLDLGHNARMKLVLIPAGTFLMGSSSGEQKAAADSLKALAGGQSRAAEFVRDEYPQRSVTISRAFYMGVYAVTNGQYEAVMDLRPGDPQLAGDPVDGVSWNDAVEFCSKLSRNAGRTVRLPTEAQWEYACRAGTETAFNFGDSIGTDQANYNGEFIFGNGRKGLYRGKTIAVGSFKPNAWGLYDMHGNILQWCGDWFGKYSATARTDPRGPDDGVFRVLRGGSWGLTPAECRSACRQGATPQTDYSGTGFRVVASVE